MIIKVARHKSPKKKVKRIASSDDDDVPFWGQIAAGVGSNLLGGLLGGKRLQTQAISPQEIQRYMQPVQQRIGAMERGVETMQGYAQDLQDPTSAMNLQQRQLMGEQGADQLALQALLSRRQQAGSGVSSGIMSAQQDLQRQQLARSLQDQFQNQMMQNRAQGMGMYGQTQGLLGNIAGMQMGVQENIAQAGIAQRQAQMQAERQRNQMWGDMFGGIGTGLIKSAFPTPKED